MEHYITLTGLAVGLFVVTNMDDIFILLGFYVTPKFRAREVVIGQFLGIAALYAVGVIGSLITLVVSPAYVGLLGFIPMAMGLKQLWELWKVDSNDDGDEETPGATSGHGKILTVAAVTIANGGDNISIYVPVFGTRPIADIAYIGIVFMVMTGVWLALAHWLVNHQTFGDPIRRYGAKVVPFALIALGLFILYESGTLRLLRE